MLARDTVHYEQTLRQVKLPQSKNILTFDLMQNVPVADTYSWVDVALLSAALGLKYLASTMLPTGRATMCTVELSVCSQVRGADEICSG